MFKRLKKWGNSLIVTFTREDIENYGLVENDYLDFDFLEQEFRKIRYQKLPVIKSNKEMLKKIKKEVKGK